MKSFEVKYYKLNKSLVKQNNPTLKHIRFSKFAIRNHLGVEVIGDCYFEKVYEENLCFSLVPNRGEKVYFGEGDKQYNVMNVFSIRSDQYSVEYHIEVA